tara:strand:+ start:248 stop:472 length:225 start_codon:yes stop_codon:yes gene_type:complete
MDRQPDQGPSGLSNAERWAIVPADKKGIQGGSGISSDGALFPSPNMVKAVNMKVNRGFEQWIGPEQDKYYAKTQ